MVYDAHSSSRPSWRGAAVVALSCLLAGAALAAGFSTILAGAQLVGVAVAAMLFLRHRLSASSGLPVAILAAAVAFHARVVSPILWHQHPSVFSLLWSRVTDVILLGLVAGCAYRTFWGFRLLAAVLLVGIPSQPAGYLWATFPVACLLLVDSPGIGPRWLWLAVTGWVCFELMRAPCRLDAAVSVSLLALAYAGFRGGQSLPRNPGWLGWIGLALAAPMILGRMWSLAAGAVPPVEGWGVNRNPLAAHTALGVLLAFLTLMPRHRVSAWAVACVGVVLVASAGSVGALACLAILLVAALAPRGLRGRAIVGLGVLPVVTPLAAMISLPWLPERILVSYMARQFHWKAALIYLGRHPWGGGLGPVHSQALGLATPPPELAQIPGAQMQHCHHLLLHIGEQGGVAAAVCVAALALWGCLRLARERTPHPAGLGALYLWLNNGADLTLLSETMILAGGLVLGIWISSSGTRRSGLWPATLMVPFGALWLTSLILAGTAERARRGVSEPLLLSPPVEAALHALWAPAAPCSDITGAPRERPSLHGRCAHLAPVLVERARPHIARWKPEEAQRLLAEAIRLDPTGVVPGGGGRARALMAMVQRQLGRVRQSRETLEGIRWAEDEATRANGAVDFFTLRRRTARVDSVLSHVMRTSKDPSLIAAFTQEKARRSRQLEAVARPAQDIIKEEVERLLANGLVGPAKIRIESRDALVDPWLRTMLWSKVAVAEGDMPRAVALASRAVAQSGGTDAARWELVGILSQSNRTIEALAETDRLLARRPHDPAVWLLRAQTLLDAGRASEALENLERARSLGADAVAWGITRSQALRMIGERAEARRLLVQLTNDRPESAWPVWELASWAEAEARLLDAARWARIALERSPGDHGSRMLLGRVLAGSGHLREAQHHFALVANDARSGPGWQSDARRELEKLKGRLDR